VELATEIDGLVLRSLGVDDLDRYAELVLRNEAHLTRNGDYRELVESSVEDLEIELREDAPGRFGVWFGDELIGRVDLILREGANAVLGYWLDRDHVARGFATASCRELLRYGVADLAIGDVWAGVTHGNDRSVAVLQRLGFEEVADMGTYARFHLALVGPPAGGEA
jgi:RimJ/RimL family protein N-acetyltransferase